MRPRSPALDAVDSVLDGLKLQSSVFSRLELGEGWGFAKDQLAGAPFHIVLDGEAWLGPPGGGDFVRFQRGDVVILPRGQAHLLTSGPDAEIVSFKAVWAELGFPDWRPGERYRPRVVRIGCDGTPCTRLISGVFEFMDRRRNPLLTALPDVLVLRASDDLSSPGARLAEIASLIDNEIVSDRAGAALVASRLADFLFIQAVRAHLEAALGLDTGWLRGLRDPQIGTALCLMHARPGTDWSVGTLALEAGMSRSLFAQQFKGLVGRGPIEYLTDWRMFEAAGHLGEGALPVVEVARRVGYQSEISFSKAFKRWAGTSPAAFRRMSP